jgi:hypothetical protein
MDCIILDKKIIIPKKMGTRFANYWDWNSLESIKINTKSYTNTKFYKNYLNESHRILNSWYVDNCKEWDEYVQNYTPEFLILRNPTGLLQSALLTEVNNMINSITEPITLSTLNFILSDKLNLFMSNHHRCSHYNTNIYKFFYSYWIQNKKTLKVVHIEDIKTLFEVLKGTDGMIKYKKEEFNHSENKYWINSNLIMELCRNEFPDLMSEFDKIEEEQIYWYSKFQFVRFDNDKSIMVDKLM